MAKDTENRRPAHKRRWLLPLVFLPFPAVLWVPFFNSAEPALAGIPFFYWYQLLWIAIGAGLTFFVYLATE